MRIPALVLAVIAPWSPRNLPVAARYALAAGVRRGNDPAPVQATGGWLDTLR